MDAFLTADGLIAFFTLTFLEVVLGVDNVIFISILVGKLPKEQQQRGRTIGLAGAMGMRILLLLSLTWIMRLTEPLFNAFNHGFSGRDLILISGGLFLLWKATVEIHDKLEGEEGHGTTKVAPSFAAVIGQIMLLDIIFSLDSVITAVGMANDIAIMIAAVVVAVAIMMFSARTIGDFVMRHPTVKVLALSFLLMIGADAHRRRRRLPHPEGLHLLRDGLLDFRGDDQPAHQARARPGETARAVYQGKRALMPFKSQAQRRKFAELLVKGEISNETFEEWNRETGSKKLPERVKKKRSKTRKTSRRTQALKRQTTRLRKRSSSRVSPPRSGSARRYPARPTARSLPFPAHRFSRR